MMAMITQHLIAGGLGGGGGLMVSADAASAAAIGVIGKLARHGNDQLSKIGAEKRCV